jgi:hypothetical protein
MLLPAGSARSRRARRAIGKGKAIGLFLRVNKELVEEALRVYIPDALVQQNSADELDFSGGHLTGSRCD